VQLVGIDSDNWPIFFVEIANMEDVLAVQRIHIIVELIPGDSLDPWQLAVRIQQSYQNVNAASLGPGKAEIGLR